MHPKAVRFFERQWLVNLILWGNYNRLRDAAINAIGSPLRGKTLQVACAYGDITPRMVQRMEPSATLDVIDVLPVQLGNLSAKLAPSDRIRLHCMNSAQLTFADQTFDQVLLFFLLHEQPADVRQQTLQEALRVLRPRGTLVIVDYSNPKWCGIFNILWRPILQIVEPFSQTLFASGLALTIDHFKELTLETCTNYCDDAYAVMTYRKCF